MNIAPEVAVHEAGHLVAGLSLGLDEQGIAFRPFKIGEAAGAWCKDLDRTPKKAIVRSFSGLLAHLHLLPDTIAPHLRLADIAVCAKEPDREFDALLLYTPHRAISIIGKK